MQEQPKFLPDQQNHDFPNEHVDRKPVEHTVPRGPIDDGSVFYTGQSQGDALATTFPVPVTLDLVKQGQEAFDISTARFVTGATDTGKELWFSAAFPSRRPFIPTVCETFLSAISLRSSRTGMV